MLVLRLQRSGRSNLPSYRLVAAEHARPVKGKYLEILGHYLPSQGDGIMEIEQERIQFWIEKGATPSDTVARLLKRKGMKNMDRFIARYSKRVSKKNPPPEAPVAVSAPASSEPASTEPATQSTPEETPGDNAQ